MTQEQEEARNWRMLKQRNWIRERVARLEDELKKFAVSWATMGRLASSPHGRVFKFDEEEIFVVNEMGQPIERLPWLHFNKEKIEDLLADLQTSNDELNYANERLRALGVE